MSPEWKERKASENGGNHEWSSPDSQRARKTFPEVDKTASEIQQIPGRFDATTRRAILQSLPDGVGIAADAGYIALHRSSRSSRMA